MHLTNAYGCCCGLAYSFSSSGSHDIASSSKRSALKNFASPCLWNQLPVSLHQPHSSLSKSDCSLSMPVTSTYCVDSLLSLSITLSLFHSRIRTYLFTSPSLHILFLLQDWLHRLFTHTISSEQYRFLVLISYSSFFLFMVQCGTLSWLSVCFFLNV